MVARFCSELAEGVVMVNPINSVFAEAGVCACILLVAVAATSVSTTPSSSSHVAIAPLGSSVDYSRKGGRLRSSQVSTHSGSIAVEISGRSDVVVRDTEGNILFAVDNTARTTTVAKLFAGAAVSRTNVTAPVEKDLPDGCEGAFSPYAEPSMAGVIGRCVSSISSQSKMASLVQQ
jgi:hypothetical protein